MDRATVREILAGIASPALVAEFDAMSEAGWAEYQDCITHQSGRSVAGGEGGWSSVIELIKNEVTKGQQHGTETD